MKKILLCLSLQLICHFLIAQNDTTVQRLEKELVSANDTQQKLSLLKELIDQTVLSNSEKCEKYIDQALILAEESRDRKTMSNIRIHIARAYTSQGGVQSLLDKAEVYVNEALKIAKGQSGLEREEIIALLTLSRVHRNSGRGEKAIEANSTAITQANDLGDDSLRVWAHVAMGRTYLYRDQKLTAFKNYLAALNIADQTKHKDKDWLLTICYRNMAEFFASIEDYDKAIDYFTKVLEYDKAQHNSVDLMSNTRQLGDYYSANKQYSIAMNYFERSLTMADSLKNFGGKVQATMSIVNSFFRSQQLQKGMEYILSHPEIETFLKQIKLGFIMDKAKASVYTQLGKFDSGMYYYNKVYPVYEAETNPYSKFQFYSEYGYALRQMGKKKEAINYFLKAKSMAEQANSLESVKETANYLDSLYQETGDYKNALVFSAIRSKLKDSLEVLSKEKDLVSLEIDAENKRKERKLKEEEEALQRRHNIQYSAIIVSILFLFIILASFGFLKVPISWIKILGFFSFIFFFEFIILIADQQIHHATHGEPWKILAVKVVLIAILLPLHHLIEKKVVTLITDQRLKKQAKVSL